MDLGVIESHDDVLGGEMEAGYHTTILGDAPRDVATTGPPGRVHQIPLFEMGFVRFESWSGVPSMLVADRARVKKSIGRGKGAGITVTAGGVAF